MAATRTPDLGKTNGWFNTLEPMAKPRQVKGTVRTDWVVLGAGVTGLSATRHLAEQKPNDRILLIEAERIGRGNSGRNSGFALHAWFHGALDDPAELEHAHRIGRLSAGGVEILRRLVRENQIECAWHDFGMLWADDPSGPYRWSCHEVVTAPDAVITPRYARGPQGTLLVTITVMEGIDADHSLYVSHDGGCDWAPSGLPGQRVSAVDWTGSHALVGTGSQLEGAQNEVYRSADGEAWTPVGLDLGPKVVSSLLGQGAIAHGTAFDPLTEETLLLHGDGELWTSSSLDLTPWSRGHLQRVQVIGFSEQALWLILGFFEGDLVLEVNGDEVQALLEVEGDLVDGGRTSEGALWVVEGSRRVWRDEGEGFAPVEDAVVSIGMAVGPDAVWLTGYADFIGALLVKAPNEVVLRPYEIEGPLACPSDSQHSRICEPLWPGLNERLQVFAPSDTGDSAAPDPKVKAEPRFACGPEGAPWGLWALALLVTRRR